MKKIMIFAAACAALFSCSREQQDTGSGSYFRKGQEVTLNVSADESATRVTSALNSNGTTVDFKWAEGDKIKVTVGDEWAEFTLSSGAGSNSATFTGKMPAEGSSFDVQYPVTDPTLTTQAYSGSEAIPHDMMKFSATGCSISSPDLPLTPQSAVLRLNLWGTSQKISKIVVTNTTSSASPKPTYTLNMNPAVTLPTTETAAQAFFIVVPVGDWNFSVEVFDNAATPESICTFEKTSTDKYFASNTVLNMSAVEVGSSPMLNGVFTINSSGTKVKFSRGNLQATYSTSTSSYSWGFAAHQWEYIGSNSGNTTISSPSDGAVVDLFGWVGASSTALNGEATKYGISTSITTSDYGNNASDVLKEDWGQISTLPGNSESAKIWRTLSNDEWAYLLNKNDASSGARTDANRFAKANVNGVNGLIIFPDGYNGGTAISGITGVSPVNKFVVIYPRQPIDNWSSMESEGCVFLPAAGCRKDSEVSQANNDGSYSSSTPNGRNGLYYLSFNGERTDASFVPSNTADRYWGRSIRLVSVVIQ